MTQTHKKQSISLQPRDKNIFRELTLTKGLTTDQLVRLLYFSGRTKCNQRTKKLSEHGFVERDFVNLGKVGLPNGPQKTTMNTLDRAGAEVIAQELGVPLETIWNPHDTTVHDLKHTICNNDMRISLKLAAQECGYSISRWETDHTLRKKPHAQKLLVEYTPNYEFESDTLNGEVIPDDLVVINTPDGDDVSLILEFDTGTEVRTHTTKPKGPDTSVATKVRKYSALLHKKYIKNGSKEQEPSLFETKTGITETRFKVIFITTGGDQAVENLVTTISKAGGKSNYLVGRFDLARRENYILTRPIFRRVSDPTNTLYPWIGERKVDIVADLLRQQDVPESEIVERIQQIYKLAQGQLEQGWSDIEIGYEQALALRVDELCEALIERFEAQFITDQSRKEKTDDK